MNNNPVTFNDPDGDIAPLLLAGIAVVGGGLNVWKNADNIKNWGDGLAAFGIGAGAAVAGTLAAPAAAVGGTIGASIASFAVAGGVGGAVAGGIEGFGNGAYFGSGNIGDRLINGIGQGIRDGVIGGVAGAAIGGVFGAGAHLWANRAAGSLAPSVDPPNRTGPLGDKIDPRYVNPAKVGGNPTTSIDLKAFNKSASFGIDNWTDGSKILSAAETTAIRGGTNFKAVTASFLQQNGIPDIHAFKAGQLGTNKNLRLFDVVRDNATHELLIIRQKTQEVIINTGRIIKP